MNKPTIYHESFSKVLKSGTYYRSFICGIEESGTDKATKGREKATCEKCLKGLVELLRTGGN